MTFVVPFDGTEPSRMGLVRAVELAPANTRVVAFAVLPKRNSDWARERDLLDDDEAFQYERVVGRLQRRAHDVSDDLSFQHTTADRYATTGTISRKIREFAHDVEATMIFIGSREAGGIVTTLQSVGTQVATDKDFDVVLVRRFDRLVPG
jgi:nucleotide-binding universal stress UspA family protein